MYSPCLEDTSQVCFNGCCSSPFTSTIAESHKPNQLEFSITTGASFLSQNTKFTDHESLPSFQTSFLDLITTFPGYLQTDQADHIRSTEYENLSSSRDVYLNHIAHPLFSYSQSQQTSESESSFFALSCKSLNSGSELLRTTTQESEFQSRVRKRIMGYMNLEESDYHMILTPDRCSAFKILAEVYPFKTNPNLLTVYNYEDEAAEEMISIAVKKGLKPDTAEFSWPSTEIRSEKLQRKITRSKRRGKDSGLFVFPLQSLVTGASYSYSWMRLAHENGWHVLLDTSALGSKDMETLGLSLFNPDFLICHFSEVLGHKNPSGFGCLFLKKSSSSILTEPELITNPTNLVVVTAEPAMTELDPGPSSFRIENDENGPEFFQEDTLDQKDRCVSSSCSEIIEPHQSIEQNRSIYKYKELEFRALDHADALGLILISRRAKYLTNWLIRALKSLRHPGSETEMPLVRIYGPGRIQNQGPSISFNIFDWQGEKVDPLLVQRLAERNKIRLECANLKNIRRGDKRRREINAEAKDVKGKISGFRMPVVSTRFGFLTNFEDVFRVWMFVSTFLDADLVEKEKWRNKAAEKNK